MEMNEKWEIKVSDERLGKTQSVAGNNQFVVKRKAIALKKHWDKVHSALTEKDKEVIRFRQNVSRIDDYSENERFRYWITRYSIEEINNLIAKTLNVDDKVDWNDLLDYEPFSSPRPDELQPKSRGQIELENSSHNSKSINQLILKESVRVERENYDRLAQWKIKKEWHDHKHQEYNRTILHLREQYSNLIPSAVEEYCDLVLNNSDYPAYFPYQWKLTYEPQHKALRIDYEIPAFQNIGLTSKFLTEFGTNQIQLMNTLAAQVSIRTVHEVFEADSVNAIDYVIFNGFSCGKCTIKLRVSKERFVGYALSEFKAIELLSELGGELAKPQGELEPIDFSELNRREPKTLYLEGSVGQSPNDYNSVNEATSAVDVIVYEDSLSGLSFFEVSVQGSKPVIKVNKDHPAYRLYNSSGKDSEFIKLMFTAWVLMENECSHSRREQLAVARARWGEMLGDIVTG